MKNLLRFALIKNQSPIKSGTKIVKCLFLLIIILLSACSDDDKNMDTSYVAFSEKQIPIPATSGEVTVLVQWASTSWKIVMDTDNGVISNISQTTGGDKKDQTEYARVKFTYNANTTEDPRTQEVFLVNMTNNERSALLIKQESDFTPILATINTSVRYQPVAGFGGMYNPKIWLGSNLITSADINKMYAPDQLGYNILRLMIYPREADWAADVQGAKLAQQHGAVIFACPWDCTDAFAETILVNGKSYKHLKLEHYQDYTNHLIKYVNYMKDNGVNLYAVSVQNEPDMEFTYWRPSEVVNFIKAHGDQIKATGVKLMSPEACGMSPEYTDPVLNDATAFGKTDILAGHLYQGFVKTWESSYVKNRHDYICGLYNSRLASAGKTWWMCEHLFNDGQDQTNPDLWQFRKWSYNMETLAQEIHACMEGYCSAYIYWYLKRFYGMMGDNDQRSPVKQGEISKNGYILSHYAKYASNTVRIKVDTSDPEIRATAHINSDNSAITLVFLNMKKQACTVQINASLALSAISAEETTEDKNMEAASARISGDGNSGIVTLSAGSIVSVRMKIK
jgi:glucuronoarabinoxylan endo-1,4-beta-xylanase